MRGNDFMELRAFDLVARHQSFSRAAEEIGVSRAAVSAIVKSLEQRLNVQLLIRTTRNVSLTDAGRELLAHLRPALDELVFAVSHIDQFREKPKGRIRLLSSELGAELYLKDLVPEFNKRQPDVQLDVHVGESTADIIELGFDAAIRPKGHIDRDMIALELKPICHQLLIASNGYIAGYGRPAGLDDLNQHRWIQVISSVTERSRIELIGSDGAQTITPDATLCVNSFGFALQMVRAHMGIALVPSAYAKPLVNQGVVEHILPAYVGGLPQLYLCYPPHHCSTLAFKSWVEFIKEWR